MDVKEVLKKQNTPQKFEKWVKSKCKTTAHCADVYKAFIKDNNHQKAAVVFKHWKKLATTSLQKIPVDEKE